VDLMNLVGQVAGAAMGGGQDGQSGGQGALLNAVMGMMSQQSGGLGGLLQTFQQSGLGDVAQSWVSTGENMNISPEQIQSVLGNEQIAALAQQVGLSPEMVSTGLTTVLPMIVDKLTPNGSVPEAGGNDLLQQGMSLLGNFLK
jgi:uncharacterized protein YidB (DUF937 family)